MKTKTLFFALFFSLPLNSFAQGGHDVGNGGDSDALEFVSIAKSIVNHWEEFEFTQNSPVTKDSFQRAVERAEVHSTDEKLLFKAFEVDAKNFPFCESSQDPRPPYCGVVFINRQRWKDLEKDRVKKIALVFHEYLGVLGTNQTRFDDYYQLSAQQFEKLRVLFSNQPVIQVSFSCLLQAWDEKNQKVQTLYVLETNHQNSYTFELSRKEYKIEIIPSYADIFSKKPIHNLSYVLYPKKRLEFPDYKNPLSSGTLEFKQGKRTVRILNQPELQLSCYRVLEEID